ncbi:MAG: hypothetical protein ACI358_05895 [Candidatus Limimorpha sp.]
MKKTLFLILICAVTFFANANNYRNDGQNYKYSVKKAVEKTFQVGDEPYLDIDGLFTDIIVNEWDKQQISFKISIEVKSDSEKKANERINSIDVRFEKVRNGVNAETVFDKMSGGFNGSTSIRMVVSVPKDVHMNLETTYGDITVGDVLNDFNAEVKYGSIRAGELNSRAKIEASYGDVTIKYAKNVNLEVDYGNAVVAKADYLNAEISYSDFSANSLEIAVIENDYSNLRIESVSELDVDNSYSDAKIVSVKRKLTAKLSYSDINIGVGGESPVFNISGKYSDVTIRNVANSSFQYSLSALYGDLKCSDIVNNGSRISNGNIVGEYGDGKAGKITISLQYGDIRISK